MELSQIQRIVDCFKIGKILSFQEKSPTKFEISTNHGNYVLANFSENLSFDYKEILFKNFSGDLLFTEEKYTKDQSPIPVTHKYDLYWCMLKLS